METGLSASDVLAIQAERNNGYGYGNNGFFGNDGAMMLFFLLAWGNNGFGGFGGNGALNQVNNEFLYTNLNNTLQNGFGQVYNGQREIINGLYNGFNSNERMMCEGFNATQRELMQNRYESAKNASDVMQNDDRNTQRIIDYMNATEKQNLRDALTTANMQLSQQAQSANLIATLKPQAVPAYLTCSPYEASTMAMRGYFNGHNCNWGNSCAC